MLAGGTSRRFGSDKLAATLDGVALLQHAIADLPAEWDLVLVGPDRELPRPATVVRENPIGSGPAAALVTGAAASVRAGATTVVSLPGDAPAGSRAAVELVRHLHSARSGAPAEVALATDADGVDQPLQLAATGTALRRLATFPDSAGMSARRLVAGLPGIIRLRLPADLTADVDTPADHARLGASVRSD